MTRYRILYCMVAIGLLGLATGCGKSSIVKKPGTTPPMPEAKDVKQMHEVSPPKSLTANGGNTAPGAR